MMSDEERELGRILRAWRDRADPRDAGIPIGPNRRSTGLRREEVALAAGVSVDYLTRLEQGRARHPSAQVLAALARALRLSTAERDHLFLLAGLLPPSAGVVDAHVTPGVQRLVERMHDLPVAVFDARWTLVMSSPLWDALMGAPEAGAPRERNLPWQVFLGASGRVRHRQMSAERWNRRSWPTSGTPSPATRTTASSPSSCETCSRSRPDSPNSGRPPR